MNRDTLETLRLLKIDSVLLRVEPGDTLNDTIKTMTIVCALTNARVNAVHNDRQLTVSWNDILNAVIK